MAAHRSVHNIVDFVESARGMAGKFVQQYSNMATSCVQGYSLREDSRYTRVWRARIVSSLRTLGRPLNPSRFTSIDQI